MRLDEAHVADILTRLRRVEGQLRGIQGMLEEGRDCADVITQFSAATRALERAGYKFFAGTVEQCVADPDAAAADGYSAGRLEKLFMQLS
jgi:DNA-binding FrmR family transcriptional regulator